jgi:LEA14-like dessication related protein
MLQFLNRTLVFAFGLSVLLSSCEFKDIELREFQDVEVSQIDKGKIEGTITVLLNNPNSFGVTVKEADFTIFAGKTEIGTAHLGQALKIEANEEKSYPVKLEGDAKDVLSGGISAVVGMLFGNDPKVVLKGEIKAKSFLISRTIPIEMETDLKMSDLNF